MRGTPGRQASNDDHPREAGGRETHGADPVPPSRYEGERAAGRNRRRHNHCDAFPISRLEDEISAGLDHSRVACVGHWHLRKSELDAAQLCIDEMQSRLAEVSEPAIVGDVHKQLSAESRERGGVSRRVPKPRRNARISVPGSGCVGEVSGGSDSVAVVRVPGELVS